LLTDGKEIEKIKPQSSIRIRAKEIGALLIETDILHETVYVLKLLNGYNLELCCIY